MRSRLALCVLTLFVFATMPTVARAQADQAGASGETRQETAEASAAEQMPVSLDRVRKGLAEEPALKLPMEAPALGTAEPLEGRPIFRVEVFGEIPKLEDLFKGFDLMAGPVPFSSPTHNEFLAMVTPKDLYSSTGITALELLTAGLSARAIEWLISQALQQSRDASERREVERIRRELQQIEESRRSPPTGSR